MKDHSPKLSRTVPNTDSRLMVSAFFNVHLVLGDFEVDFVFEEKLVLELGLDLVPDVNLRSISIAGLFG